MSVLIKGMEMPTSCWRCTLSQLYEKPREMLVCKITHEEVLRHKIDGNCPLVPIPPHGRLIDADALMGIIAKNMNEAMQEDNYDWWSTCSVVGDFLMNAPTIIEAEESET